MTYAYLTVKVNLEAGSFVRTPEEAKNMVERILQMHPQRRAYGMEVEIQERHPSFQTPPEEDWGDVIDDDYVSSHEGMIMEGLVGDELAGRRKIRNVFDKDRARNRES